MSFIIDNWAWIGPVAGFGSAWVPAGIRKARAAWKASRATK